MRSGEEVQAHLNALHEAVWELAAIALALGDRATTDPDQRRAAEDVLVEAGLMISEPGGRRPSNGLAEVIGGNQAGISSQAATSILQSGSLLTGAQAWISQDDESILAQGRASAQAAQPFKRFVIPRLEGLGDLLAEPSPVMLDVGVGVAGLAVAFCQAFPNLTVVGLDVFPRALELARHTVDKAGLADRIELRAQDIAELRDRDAFCLGWMPAPFVPRAALDAGLPRMAAALVPGGWLMVGHGKFGAGARSDALTRFQTLAFGGSAIDGYEAVTLLRNIGLERVATLPTPLNAPGITVGRRPVTA